MELSEEQMAALAAWVRAGASLADVQKRLFDEFEVSMTYMDVRFLVDDLELKLQDRPEPKEPDLAPSAEDAIGVGGDDGNLGGEGGVKVDLDRVLKPGAVASGSVVFSDGVSADWTIDQLGRLSLDPSSKGYRPEPEDIQEFQVQLEQALRGRV